MEQKQKNKNIKKKKMIIIIAFVLMLAIILGILTVVVIYFHKQDISQKSENIVYYNEDKDEKKENNVLIVGIDEPETNEENTTESENPESNEPKTNNSDKNDNSNTKKSADIPYYIKVNNQANVVTVYKKDRKGEYNAPVKAMICSIGDATPESGVFAISDKYTWRLLQGNVYGQYACRITGHILFHSVPYTAQDKSTLEWWEYDKLGTKASLGCIRLKVEDVKWIYNNCVSGTKVEFYSSSNPGPLGKPTAKKISNDEEVRNWDPTDPDPNNPWKDYLKGKEEEKQKAEEQKKAEEAKKKAEEEKKKQQELTNSKPVIKDEIVNKNDKVQSKQENNVNDKVQSKVENNVKKQEVTSDKNIVNNIK